MAIVQMQKIALSGLILEKEPVLNMLQNFANIEIIDYDKSKLDKIIGENIYFEHKEDLELELAEIQYAINLLEKYYKGKKPGLLESFIGNKLKVTDDDKKIIKNLDYKEIIKSIKEIEQKLIVIDQEKEKIKQKLAELTDLRASNINFSDKNQLPNFSFFIGAIGKNQWNDFLNIIDKTTKQVSINKINSQSEKEEYFYLLYPKNEKAESIQNTIGEFKIRNLDFLFTFNEPISQVYSDLYKKDKDLTIEKNKLIKNVNDFTKYRIPLMAYYDKLNWSIQSGEGLAKAVKTAYTYTIFAWVPENKFNKLEQKLINITKHSEITKLDMDENDVPPTVLANSKFMQPFEAVTNIYGMPKYTELDPTPFLAIFFIIFLALCLTDAGYGIVVVILTYWMLAKADLPDTRLVKLLNYGGWVTVIAGTLTGGWFGIDLNAYEGTILGDILLNLRVVDPIANPIAIMILSLILGIVHVWFGIFLKFYGRLKKKEIIDAWLDEGPWLYFLLSIMLFIAAKAGVFPASMTNIFTYILYSGVILIILTQGRSQKNIFLKIPSGVLKLYDIIGYFSDTLSYSRLLALGLATGIIGLVINMIASIFLKVPYIGWLIFLVIIIGGHLFNIAINLLGAFIHSARLQYVEFFTKFLEGGGKRFKPFKKNNFYTNIIE